MTYIMSNGMSNLNTIYHTFTRCLIGLLFSRAAPRLARYPSREPLGMIGAGFSQAGNTLPVTHSVVSQHWTEQKSDCDYWLALVCRVVGPASACGHGAGADQREDRDVFHSHWSARRRDGLEAAVSCAINSETGLWRGTDDLWQLLQEHVFNGC